MKNILLLLLILVCADCKSQETEGTEKINVLFIGNSLTYYYDMPETLQKMINETNSGFNIEQSTFPGISLDGHLNSIIELQTENRISTRKKEEGEKTETEIKLSEKDWDIIVLQEGTVRLLIPEAKEYKVETAIAEIKNRISNQNCKFILFKTWPSKKEYPKQYCYSKWAINHSLENDEYCSPEIKNLEQEIELINEAYGSVAEKYGLILSDNGNIVYEILTQYPDIKLYEDNIHPNKYGAFLNACIFYQMLTDNKASDLKYHGEIESKTADILKRIVQ
ncbi:DUF4886 domain-containing protein [Flagellimonas oceanensis]|uniref:DUF4886 domain-containing protein n=1 Tax=Flagellimonas oceanensis TaxID=2499163 RepID=UPI000F8DB374|nr:DUF4886 domain-containing protein [Allomuricauda oceanensis]|tara:strand:- start:37188 stop:38024 length:837 start_codon:yes stop_codon:yes gene_type:complete